MKVLFCFVLFCFFVFFWLGGGGGEGVAKDKKIRPREFSKKIHAQQRTLRKTCFRKNIHA